MEEVVLFEEQPSTNGKRIGIATLNAEKSLNALSLDMIDVLTERLNQWRDDPAITCVFLQGSGEKAFCAGGDIVRLYQGIDEGGDYPQRFFAREYRLDYLIHTYQKPIVVWGTGVVMGGGLGLMSGASHRVVTETTRMAMPEVTIGLYPDVGGTWFLNHAPGRTGLFLGLTGASINAADAIFVGLADRFVEQAKCREAIEALAATDWSERASGWPMLVSRVLREFEKQSAKAMPQSPVREHYDQIQALTDRDSVEERVAAITGYNGDDPWLAKAAKGLASGCPTTVYLVEEQLRRGHHLGLREVFQMELVMSVNCARLGNFREGVRALLIEKDRNPRFSPATLEEVTPEFIEQHFIPPWGNDPHPLADL